MLILDESTLKDPRDIAHDLALIVVEKSFPSGYLKNKEPELLEVYQKSYDNFYDYLTHHN